jgi:hypothetical protein
MESEIEHISSKLFDQKGFQKQLDIIINASEVAQDKIDYDAAHDDNVIRAIEIVEHFLRKKHRLCYGGQAINAHLPDKYKFYNPENSIPDYDFFTPQQDKDIVMIVKDLKKAGFTEISAREGIHKGTVKIYVDYIPVADITSIDPKLYRILSKREFKTDGISYLDANTLRMLMYLELSRPRGEVGRWSKVFERLSLFNEFISCKPCKISNKDEEFNIKHVQFTINYIIKNKRIFAGADLLDFYHKTLHTKKVNTKWLISNKKPIIFFSNEFEKDSEILKSEFVLNKDRPITIKSYVSGIELTPPMKIICQGKKPLVFIINETACHSYYNVPIMDGANIKIASMDTLIALYFSLGLVSSNYFNIGSMECMANKLVEISSKARTHSDKFPLPFISIKCIGYQPSFPSLIREKVKRLTEKKKHIKKLITIPQKQTVKRSIKRSIKR